MREVIIWAYHFGASHKHSSVNRPLEYASKLRGIESLNVDTLTIAVRGDWIL